MLALLQSYGPLTVGQLEYNLPPISRSIQDILDILVCIGLIQKVQDTISVSPPLESTTTTLPAAPPMINNSTATTPQLAAAPQPPPLTSNPTRYCVCRGVPRADPVFSKTLQAEIADAHRQAERSFERSQLLLKALKKSDEDPQQLLKSMLKQYPEIIQDPVYLTALRNCSVDLGGEQRRGWPSNSGGGGGGGGASHKLGRPKKTARLKPRNKAVTISAPVFATTSNTASLTPPVVQPAPKMTAVASTPPTTMTTVAGKVPVTSAQPVSVNKKSVEVDQVVTAPSAALAVAPKAASAPTSATKSPSNDGQPSTTSGIAKDTTTKQQSVAQRPVDASTQQLVATATAATASTKQQPVAQQPVDASTQQPVATATAASATGDSTMSKTKEPTKDVSARSKTSKVAE